MFPSLTIGVRHRATIQLAVVVGARILFLLAFAIFCTPDRLHAQVGFGAVGGVYVDPEGILRETKTLSRTDLMNRLFAEGTDIPKTGAVQSVSPLRKISLRRLDRALAELEKGASPPAAEMKSLAGLTAVQYVFFLPDEGDVVLAGTAEGWQATSSGDFVGIKTGRPVLRLDDLVIAMRYAFSDKADGSFLGCSIDPTDEGLQEYARFVSGVKGLDRSQIPQLMRGMEQAIGPQRVQIFGVEPSSRFALQMLAADYRLKRLALGHDPSPSKKVPSYLDLAAKNFTGGPQQQHRWWFVGSYDAILRTPDGTAFQFVGAGVRVDTAPTNATASQGNPKPSKSATLFAEAATRGFPELASKIPAFAQLQNLVSLAVAAELIKQQASATDGESGWKDTFYLNEKRFQSTELPVPRQVPAIANVRLIKDRHWMFSVSGGVELNPTLLANKENHKPAPDDKLAKLRERQRLPESAVNWWWD